jgi:hypothetical protein
MSERDTMLDFDLDTPISKILTDMLDKVEGHVGDCDCVNCNSLEVLAYMIMVEEENVKQM